MNKDKIVEVVDLFIENEKLLCEIYSEFAQQIPEKKDFWSQISAEENSHKMWIRGLKREIDDKTAKFDEDIFSKENLIEGIENVRSVRKRVEREKITHKKALELAYEIEINMSETDFFSAFHGVSDAVKRVFTQLEIASRKHVQTLKLEIENTNG